MDYSIYYVNNCKYKSKSLAPSAKNICLSFNVLFSPNLQNDLKIQDKAFNLRENKALETCNNTGNRFHQAELTATWQAFPLWLSL